MNSKSVNILLILCISVMISGCNLGQKRAKTVKNQIVLDTKQEENAKTLFFVVHPPKFLEKSFVDYDGLVSYNKS